MSNIPYRNVGFFFVFLMLLVVAGFTPRIAGTPFFGYFGQIANAGRVPAVIHAHAVAALTWFALLALQAFLIRANRRDLHRAIGKSSVVIAAMLFVTSLLVMKHFYTTAIETFPRDAVLSALAQSFTGLTLFVLFFFLALKNRRNIYRHFAYMVAAALATATPGLARLGLYVVGGLPGILLVVALIYATLLGFLLHAKIRLRQPVWRGPYPPIIALFLVGHAMDFVGRQTPAWLWFADKIVSIW